MKKPAIVILSFLLFCSCTNRKLDINKITENDLNTYNGRTVSELLGDINEEYNSYYFYENQGYLCGCSFIYKKKIIDIYIMYDIELDNLFKRMQWERWRMDAFAKLKIDKVKIMNRAVSVAIDNKMIMDWIRLQFTERDSDEFYSLLGAVADFEFHIKNDPKIAWLEIMATLEINRSDTIMEQLSAGPLKEFLINNGRNFIDDIEKRAKSDPTFASLLGGLLGCNCEYEIDENVWIRVQSVWNLKGWGGFPNHRIAK